MARAHFKINSAQYGIQKSVLAKRLQLIDHLVDGFDSGGVIIVSQVD